MPPLWFSTTLILSHTILLHNTFIHIPGIGEKTESQIWQAGIHTWDQWRPPYPTSLPESKVNLITYHLEQFKRINDGSPAFYAKLLSSNQHWRLFPHFREKTAYLDIETNGMSGEECEITTIALYDGRTIRAYVQGRNLNDFIVDIADFDVIVTYNGKSFDVPVIESWFHTRLDHVHIDLRHILARLGYRGGLKGCEKQLGIQRMDLEGVNGYFAVLFWKEFCRTGEKKALHTLLAYNIADAVNLERLLVHSYNLNIATTPFRLSNYLPVPEPPESPFSPDRGLVARLKETFFYK
ncbi:MAG: ribonuclease H-like domain-containing protein [Pseudomonadota bacterium]